MHFRDKLRNLTQFQEQEDDLEAQYIEKLRAIGNFVETEIKTSVRVAQCSFGKDFFAIRIVL